ncbi:MAG: HIT family protein [Frankia sp.]
MIDGEPCYSCDRNRELDRLAPRERVFVDVDWRVAHAFNSALPGWLVLLPRRHVTSLVDLTNAETAKIGPLLGALSRALGEVTGCVKSYVMLFAEAEGFAHLHFHVVPRMLDQPIHLRGPAVFGYLDQPPERRVPAPEMDRVAVEIGRRLPAVI